jgi:hypothetical protein
MNIDENLLLLVPAVISPVMPVRWLQGKAVFTERDWVLLFGHPREKALTLRLWLRFAIMLLVVVAIGFALYVLPYGLVWFVGALILDAVAALFIPPKSLS